MINWFDIGQMRTLNDMRAMHNTHAPNFLHPNRENPGFHDFVFMDAGKWYISVEDEDFEVYPGDVFICPAYLHSFGKIGCPTKVNTIYFHMNPVIGDAVHEENAALTALPLKTVIHCGNHPIIRELFEELAFSVYSEKTVKDSMISTLISTLIVYLNKYDIQNSDKRTNLTDNCISIMIENPNVIFTESEMASRLFVSPKTLRESFQTQFGKSFYHYQLESKLNRVRVCISDNPERKLYDIAKEMGFCDEYHLSKLFSKQFGISPAEYRKQNNALNVR